MEVRVPEVWNVKLQPNPGHRRNHDMEDEPSEVATVVAQLGAVVTCYSQ
jgi:hypothetical protein